MRMPASMRVLVRCLNRRARAVLVNAAGEPMPAPVSQHRDKGRRGKQDARGQFV